MDKLKIFLRIMMFMAVLVGAVAFFWKDRLPDSAVMRPELQIEPLQTLSGEQPIIVIEQGGFRAELEVMYAYEISGLVVEDYDSEVWHDVMHKKFDPFNTKDLCLLWGGNVENDLYQKIKFSHGEFTCFYQTRDMDTYRRFDKAQISNNHLIPASEDIYERLKKTSVGDQVRIKGYLVNNRILTPDGTPGLRMSSVTRTDTGNGACEQIYVLDYEILAQGNPIATGFYVAALYVVAVGLALRIGLFFYEIRQSWRKLSYPTNH